jgi:two-component system response regulator AtoC
MLLRLVLSVESKELEDHFQDHFTQADVRVECLGHLKNPFQKALRTSGDIFIISTHMIPDPIESGIAVLNDLPENPTIIILHDSDSAREQADLVTSGADVVLFAGLPVKNLIEAIESTLEARRQLVQKNWQGRRPTRQETMGSFMSESPQMKILMDTVEKIVPSNAPVLILGETGVGKEHLAKVLHNEGPRSSGPFVAVNCAALPEQLLESELFGHEVGAFTGAVRTRRGAFEMAHGGTILLDEIGELPLHLQVKLLRVLQEYEVQPVGSEKSTWVDIRVIATTNRDVEEDVKNGTFRKDLYYRLSVLTLTVPPLRNRREDIPALIDHYMDLFCVRLNKEVSGITDNALIAMEQYRWPGNVRELINVIERSIILCQGERITLRDLPQGISKKGEGPGLYPVLVEMIENDWRGQTLPEVKTQVVDMVERAYIQRILAKTQGKIGAAAQKTGIHPRGLYNKMKQFGFHKEDFKPQH